MFGSKTFSIAGCLAFVSSVASAAIEERAIADHAVAFRTIFVPPSKYITPKTLYGRAAQLPIGDLLATWENYSPEPPFVYFPIYKSIDKGSTWAPLSNVADQVNGRGLRYQPLLCVLPQAIGNLAEGTILCAGNSIPSDLSKTKIDIYASTDSGWTRKFVSSVASDGEAEPTNGPTPVWEPFLVVYNNQLVTYYTDQRNPSYGQYLVYQMSLDGVNWGPVVHNLRRTPRHGHYRTSTKQQMDHDLRALSAGGTIPTPYPYVVWSSAGGVNGKITIVVSANSNTQIFVSTKLGDPNTRVEYSTPQYGAYSRHLRVMDNPDWLLILSAGYLGGNNYVANSVMELPNL